MPRIGHVFVVVARRPRVGHIYRLRGVSCRWL